MAGGKVFLNYRRDDSEGYTGRIYDRLNARFPGRIFRDVVGLQPGEDFVDALEREGVACEVLVAIIGKRWLGITDAAGKRRLDNADDVLRQEIFNALKRNILVIPLLVGGAVMPGAEELPADLAFLARRQALSVSEVNFDVDIGRLMQRLEKALGECKPPQDEETHQKDELSNLLALAQSAKAQQDWHGAVQALRAALSLSPSNPEVAAQLNDAVQQQQVVDLFHQGQQFYQAQNYRGALDCFRRVRVLGGNYNDVDRLIALVEESSKPPKKSKRLRWIIGGSVAAIFVLGLIVSAVQDQQKRESTPAPADPTTADAGTPTDSSTSTPPPAQQAQPADQNQDQATQPAPADSSAKTAQPAPAFDPTGDWTVEQFVNGQPVVLYYVSLRADGAYRLSNPQGEYVSDGNWTYAAETQALNFVGSAASGVQPWMVQIVDARSDYIDIMVPNRGPMRMFRQ
jgi:tetratricopeptide (TPR) repeat protein